VTTVLGTLRRLANREDTAGILQGYRTEEPEKRGSIDTPRLEIVKPGAVSARSVGDLSTWTPDIWEAWDERVAIRCFDGGLPLEEAEREATRDVERSLELGRMP